MEKLPENEKVLDRYISTLVKAKKGIYLKMSAEYNSGVPDRLVILQSTAFFLELKSKGKKPTLLQNNFIQTLENLALPCFVITGGDDSDLIHTLINT